MQSHEHLVQSGSPLKGRPGNESPINPSQSAPNRIIDLTPDTLYFSNQVNSGYIYVWDARQIIALADEDNFESCRVFCSPAEEPPYHVKGVGMPPPSLGNVDCRFWYMTEYQCFWHHWYFEEIQYAALAIFNISSHMKAFNDVIIVRYLFFFNFSEKNLHFFDMSLTSSFGFNRVYDFIFIES